MQEIASGSGWQLLSGLISLLQSSGPEQYDMISFQLLYYNWQNSKRFIIILIVHFCRYILTYHFEKYMIMIFKAKIKIKFYCVQRKLNLLTQNKIKIIQIPIIMSRAPDSSQTTSFLSVSRKREALWNVLEPGDPYDIRKSMIAKVPGDKKAFMGDHLELVCLFQAAEIQRLCEFLDDFKLKYRQIERRELDRHSYEVQIKQLTHKLAEQTGFRQENQKLRQFIKNQSTNKQGMQDSIKFKYEKLLLQIKSYEDQNLRLKRQNDQISASYDAKFEALQKSKQTQFDELRMKFSQQSSMTSQYQINSVRNQYQTQIHRLDLQNQRLKESNQDQLHEIQNQRLRIRSLEEQVRMVSLKGADISKYQKQINDYESRFIIFGQQIDRLNLVIKQITIKFDGQKRRSEELQNRNSILTRQIQQIQSKSQGSVQSNLELAQRLSFLELQNKKLQQSGKYLPQYENKLKQMSEEITRLNEQLKIQGNNVAKYKGDIQRYQYEQSRLKILENQVNQYKSSSNQNNVLKMKIAEDQNKIAILKQQLDRLREELMRKGGQDAQYRSIMMENQNLHHQISDWERKFQMTRQQYQTKIAQKTSQYESRIDSINRTKGNEFQSKFSIVQSQVKRLEELLRRKNQEADNFQRQVRELEFTITNKYELDANRRIQNYESNIQNMKRQNEDLLRKVRQIQPLQRRVNELQNKLTTTSQEIQRLNQEISYKQRQIKEQEITITQKYEMDTSRKLGSYEMNMNNLNRQNQDLKRRYQEMENKTALLSQQIQRLTNKTRQFQSANSHLEQQLERLQRFQKQSEVSMTKKFQFQIHQKISNYENVIRNSQRESEELKRRIIDLENGNRKIVQYQSRLSQMGQQLQRLGSALRQKQQESAHLESNNRNLIRQFQDLGRKYNELQITVRNKYEVESTRTITTLEQNVTNFKRENDELKRYLQQYQNRLKAQNSDFEGLNMNLRNLSQQNENLKRQIRQLQNSIKNKLEVEVTGKYHSYETNIGQLKNQLDFFARENNQLKRVIQNAQQSNIKLNQQNEDLRKRFQQDFGQISKKINEYEMVIKQLQNDNQNLRRKVLELQTVIRQKYEIEVSRRISSLDQNLLNSNRQNEQLRRRIELNVRQIQDLRKVVQNMERDNEQLARRLRDASQINRKIVQYQNKIAFLSQQLQKTSMNLKTKIEDLNKAEKYIRDLSRELENAQSNIHQSHSSLQQYEMELKARGTQFEQNITALSQQNNELKRRLNILDDMNRKISEYENKIVILNQQLQRVNQNLRNQVQKSNQLENVIRGLTNQNEQLKRKFIEMQNSITQKYQVQTTKVIRTLQQNFEALQRQNNQLKTILHEFQQKGNLQNSQLQKLALNLKNLGEQNNALRNQVRETQISITRKYQTEVNSKYSLFERDIGNFKRQNEDLSRKLMEYAQRVVPQYQNQVALLKQQIQRLNQHLKQESGQLGNNIRNLSQQNDALKRQIIEIQQTITQKYEVQVNKKYSSYEQSIGGLQKENQDLKRYIKQFGGKYESDIKGVTQNFNLLQRQNQQLKRSIQQISLRFQAEIKKSGNVQLNLTGLSRQNQDLKRRLVELQQEFERLVRKLNELQQQNQLIKRQSKQTEIQITNRYQSESTQQINVYKQQIVQIQGQWKNVQRQNEELQRRLNDVGGDANRKFTKYEQEIKKMIAEIQRLNGGIRQYDAKLRQYDVKLREISGENEALKRQNRQNQINISQRWETQLRNKQLGYEQTMQSLNRQVQQRQRGLYETSNKRIMELENKVVLVSQEVQRLTISLKSKSQENQKMRAQIQRLNNTLRLKLQEGKQVESELHKFRSATQTQFSQLQSSYQIITRQNQNYKKHLSQYQISLKKLYAEFERLQNIINDLKKQREALFEKNYALSSQIDRLLSENKDLQVQVEDVRLRLSDQSALHKRINEHMGLMVVLFAQIQSLRRRVKDKQKEVEDVRRSSLAPFKLQSRARGQYPI